MSTQRDWAQDYDLFDPEYAADPYPIWAELRTACPVAHTDRYGGSWLTTTYDDVTRVARDPATFSSRDVSVIPPPDDTEAQLLPVGLPPIQADPPVHTWTRRLLLPWFSNDRVAAYEGYTRELCRTLLDGFAESGRIDAAADYAKQVPVRVIGKMLGIPEEMSDTFIEWVRSVLEFANDAPRRTQAQINSTTYFLEEMEARRTGDGTDLISELLRAEFRTLSASASFNEWAGFDVVRVVPGECDLRLAWRGDDMGQYAGFLHAGLIAALLDTACGFAAAAIVGSVLSSHFSMNCLAPAVGDEFVALGRVVKAGRKQVFTSGELHARRDVSSKLVAMATAILIPTEVPIDLHAPSEQAP